MNVKTIVAKLHPINEAYKSQLLYMTKATEHLDDLSYSYDEHL